jgi:hypothetical protein
MFGIFTSRPKDYLIATNNTNVNSIVNNIKTDQNFQQITLKPNEIYSLTEFGLTEKAIKEYIEPVCYSQKGSFKEILFEVTSSHAKVQIFVGVARNTGSKVEIKFYNIITTGNVIQQYDQMARYKWRGGWLGKAITGQKKFSHYENVPRGLTANELNLIKNKLMAVNDEAVRTAIAKLSN